MIEAKDLRIGNYVYYERDDKVNTIEGLNFAGICTLSISGVDLINHIEPISLTEEWLIKFGFKYYDNGVGFKAAYYCMTILKSDFYFRPSYQGGFYWGWDMDKGNELEDVQPVLYVHQLQNLYFALTGEELTINSDDSIEIGGIDFIHKGNSTK